MSDQSDFSFFRRIHASINIRIDISISMIPMTNHQIWQAGASRQPDSNETNQAGAGNAIM